MATATKKKPKAKPLKGGNNSEPASDEPLIPVPEEQELPVAPTIKNDGTIDDGLPIADEPITVASPLNPANAYDSPEALAEWDKETARLVAEFNGTVSELESEWETSHTITAAKKKTFEAALDELRSLIRSRRENRGKPPQPKPAPLYADPDSMGEGAALPNVPEDEAWKSIPLSELAEKDGFPAYLVEKLANAARKDDRPCPPIVTLGDLVAFTEPEQSGYTKKLSDIVGIGAGAVDKITDATIKFWERWAKEGNGVAQSGEDHASEPGDGSEDLGDGDDDEGDPDSIAEPQGLPD